MFINYSNHPSSLWNEEQLCEAKKWGDVEDIPFPTVPPEADEKEIALMAEKEVNQILEKNPDIVMCQGEFTLTYAVVNLLKKSGLTVVAACSERITEETVGVDGISKKVSRFKFIRFREF